jgi:hypothetical protein
MTVKEAIIEALESFGKPIGYSDVTQYILQIMKKMKI